MMSVNRINCPARQILRDSIMQMSTLRGQPQDKVERDQLIYDLRTNIRLVANKTKENFYCKQVMGDPIRHYEKLAQHLTSILARLGFVMEEFRNLDMPKAIEYANMIELNVAELHFFIFRCGKTLGPQIRDAHEMLRQMTGCVLEIKKQIEDEAVSRVFQRLLAYLNQFESTLRELNLVYEGRKTMNTSNNSINSSLSSNSSSLAGFKKSAEPLKLAAHIAQKNNISGVKNGLFAFTAICSFIKDIRSIEGRRGKGKNIELHVGEWFLQCQYDAIEKEGMTVTVPEYKSCIALLVCCKILNKLLLEIELRIAEEEDPKSENALEWTSLRWDINKAREEIMEIKCKCYDQ